VGTRGTPVTITLTTSKPSSSGCLNPKTISRDSPAARSVDNDDDARWLAQRLHRSFGSSVDVNPRFLGWLLLVIGAGPVELSIAQHNAALGENGTLQFCDSLGIDVRRDLAGPSKAR
jgi:hypothetical protein